MTLTLKNDEKYLCATLPEKILSSDLQSLLGQMYFHLMNDGQGPLEIWCKEKGYPLVTRDYRVTRKL